jgi:pyruvate/2-oxoglutarate dehydrogenase complex dihydrolipoamide acyltransferase (E2) component
MKREFLMPKLGLTMTEGVLAEWSLPAGALFTKGQTVYVVETDKTANDVVSEDDGILLEIVHMDLLALIALLIKNQIIQLELTYLIW